MLVLSVSSKIYFHLANYVLPYAISESLQILCPPIDFFTKYFLGCKELTHVPLKKIMGIATS